MAKRCGVVVLLVMVVLVCFAFGAAEARLHSKQRRAALKQRNPSSTLTTAISVWCRGFSDSPEVAKFLKEDAFLALIRDPAAHDKVRGEIVKRVQSLMATWLPVAVPGGLAKHSQDALAVYFTNAIYLGRFVGCPWATPCDVAMTKVWDSAFLLLAKGDPVLAKYGESTGSAPARTIFQALDTLCAQIWDNTQQGDGWHAYATTAAEVPAAGYAYEGSFVQAIANKVFSKSKDFGDPTNHKNLHRFLEEVGKARTQSGAYHVPPGTNPTCPMGPFCGQVLRQMLGSTSTDPVFKPCGQAGGKDPKIKPTYQTAYTPEIRKICPEVDLKFANSEIATAAKEAFAPFDLVSRESLSLPAPPP